jgi:hypothetical protein
LILRYSLANCNKIIGCSPVKLSTSWTSKSMLDGPVESIWIPWAIP